MATKTMTLSENSVILKTSSSKNEQTAVFDQQVAKAKRSYPDITKEQSFWDKAVLS